MINDIIWLLIKIFNYFVLAFFVGFNSFYLLTSLLAFRALRKYSKRLKSVSTDELLSSSGLPPITLIAPAFNEEATCVESAKSLLTLNYPDYEVLVINDGSTDHTLEQLTEAFDLIPLSRLPMAEIKTAEIRGVYRSKRFHRLWVIDKVNGGKSDAINVGINYCRDPLFCVLDADSLLERNALIRIVRPFLEDQKTVATGGIIRIINGCTVRSGSVEKVELPDKLLPRFQVLEYLRAFLFGRMGWDAVNATLIISGAFGIFKRSIVVQVGGYSTDTVGEDMELIVRIHRHCRENKIPYRINFIPDPVAWTECPETLRVLGRQRDRWQRGLWDSLTRHKTMLLNPKYGAIGLLAYPYFFVFEMLGPIIEFFGYISFFVTLALGKASIVYVSAFFTVAFLLGIALSVSAVGLDELSFRRYKKLSDLMRLFVLAIVENFGYRQFLTFYRFKGIISAIRHKKGWGKMERKGFSDKSD